MLAFIPATLMGLPVLPVAILSLAGGAYYAVGKRGKNYGKMTTERQIVLDTALQSLKDPDKLNALAAKYDKCGCTEAASILRKRAVLRTLPPEMKKARREVYSKAMKCTDPVKVRKVASCFEKEGATGAAAELNAYADGLQAMQSGAK